MSRPSPMMPNRLRSLPWWVVLLLGIAAIALGLALVLSPKNTITIFFSVAGVVAMLAGAVTIVRIPWDRRVWGWKLSGGALALILGQIMRTQPLLSAYVVSAIIFWTMGVGVLFAGAAVLILGIAYAGIAYILVGVLGLAFGIFLVFTAVIGSVAIPSLFGIIGVLVGVLIIGAAFQSRSQAQFRTGTTRQSIGPV